MALFSCSSLNVGEKYLTFAPLPLPVRFHTMSVGSQNHLTYSECGSLAVLESLRLTEHIQTQGAPCPRQSRASKPQDKGSRRDELRLPPRVMEHKIAQVFPVRPGFRVVKHTVADSVDRRKKYVHTPSVQYIQPQTT